MILLMAGLAFGGGLSRLVGKAFGRVRLPFTGGKSLEGSLTCLFAVFLWAMDALFSNAIRLIIQQILGL